MLSIAEFVDQWSSSPFKDLVEPPWSVTQRAETVIADAIPTLPGGYQVVEGIAVHASATIEPGAVLKSPAIIGPRCYVAASAYLRGGVFLDEGCIVGPGAELKSSFMFQGSKLAHLNFVGDSILGAAVNLEAGSIIANYRNELPDSRIALLYDGQTIETGVQKFGALVGDRVRIGANAVIAPGAVLRKDLIVARLSLIDQRP